MAKTGVAELSESVQTKYMADYLLAAANKAVWSQFVDWDTIVEGQGGSKFHYVAYQPMDSDDLGAVLPEKDDIEATALTDSKVEITPYEYGRRVTLTSKLRFQSHVKTRQATAKLVGQNMTDTVERAIRRGVLSGLSNVHYGGAQAARDALTTTDGITFTWLSQFVSMARSMGIEPIGEDFVAVIHPALEPDILAMAEVKGIGYNFPEPLYKGEMARFMGIRFIRSRFGKLYLSGGLIVTNSPTTLTAAALAGALTIDVTSITEPVIAVGNWLTLGTLEAADAEQVQVTKIETLKLTVRGAGNGATNFGLQFAHPNGANVNAAANAGAICLLGANSVKGVYGSNTGKYGKSVIKADIDSLNRLLSLGWYWYGGIGIVEKYVLRGEVYTAQHVFGGN